MFYTKYWNENCEKSVRDDQDQGNITTRVPLAHLDFHINGKLFVLTFILSGCPEVADNVLYNVVDGIGFMNYNSAQKKACSCIPDDQTTSTQLVQPKTTAIDIEQSKSIFQNIYDNLSEMFWKFIDLLNSSPIVQSAISIVKSVINFFRGMCESFFGVTPLKAEAGLMDILSFKAVHCQCI